MLTTLLQSIGRTPLLRLSRLAAGLPGMLLLKLENQNPGGSIKDRAAFHILDRAIQRGELAGEPLPDGSARTLPEAARIYRLGDVALIV